MNYKSLLTIILFNCFIIACEAPTSDKQNNTLPPQPQQEIQKDSILGNIVVTGILESTLEGIPIIDNIVILDEFYIKNTQEYPDSIIWLEEIGQWKKQKVEIKGIVHHYYNCQKQQNCPYQGFDRYMKHVEYLHLE